METSEIAFCSVFVLAPITACALTANHIRIVFSWARPMVFLLFVHPAISPSILRAWIWQDHPEALYNSVFSLDVHKDYKPNSPSITCFNLQFFVVWLGTYLYFILCSFISYHLSWASYSSFLNLSFSLWNWDSTSHLAGLFWDLKAIVGIKVLVQYLTYISFFPSSL